ncbi:MAG: transaldolase [Puniceicoccaceae bacterium]|nr:MAG: transaldolase [Puniceicoccaceae bacterium]
MTDSSTANQLDQLRRFSVVVADTGDFHSIRQFNPRDATTNPSLILKALENPAYGEVLDRAVIDTPDGPGRVMAAIDRLLVGFGLEILKLIDGRVSTETDARHSFNTAATIDQARALIALYEEAGIDRDRVLIKIASTWEGIAAAEELEREGIHCNLTLLFSLVQAVRCAEAGVTLISPFVGRILDWHRARTGGEFTPENDPGVLSVRTIYTYFKKFGLRTEVMAASFRSVGQILALAGCDLLTISPTLLEDLRQSHAPLSRQLDPATARTADLDPIPVDEPSFRYRLNDDAMATEKTAEGIRGFAADTLKLENLVRARLD